VPDAEGRWRAALPPVVRSLLRSSRARLLAIALLATLIVVGTPVVRAYLRSAALIATAANLRGPIAARLTTFGARKVDTEEVRIPTRSGWLRGREYLPGPGNITRTVVLSAGVNPRGLDEPRLAAFARSIAARGIAVVTPELPDLVDFRVTPRLTDEIEDTAHWVAGQARLAPDGHVGLVGISFSGGLSIVAAGRQQLRQDVAYVVSLGGHGDLPRTLQFLGTGRLPDGTPHPAHDYGGVVVLHNVAGALVPPAQVDGLREGTRTYLLASTVYMTDKPRGLAMFERARQIEATLPEPARTLMHDVNTRDTRSLGPQLLPTIPAFASAPALSPERSAPPRAPVFLLHGADDRVVPAAETVALAQWLTARGTTVRYLITPLISHAEVATAPPVGEVWRLIRFWADVVDR
jgi:dienelactone hydrolase